eukprot:PhF_6_TR28143/c0_g1_i1/m.41680/K04515/CAMK2; calcium/calmodulin-dependent protein kinase (CaM kinase) II
MSSEIKTPRFHEHYTLQRKIGSGAFSTVFLCNKKGRETFTAVAKVIPTKTQSLRDKALREGHILQSLNSDVIVQCYDVFADLPDEVVVVLEYVPEGSLPQHLSFRDAYSERVGSGIIKCVLDALSHCHLRHILHRDIKPENILVCDKMDLTRVKLCDFGFACEVGERGVVGGSCGTPLYVAPEVIAPNAQYGYSADLWSLGVLTYFLLVGQPPFSAPTLHECMKLIQSGYYEMSPEKGWGNISEKAKDFVRRLLVVDPTQRMTLDEALQHPWLEEQPDDFLQESVHRFSTYALSNTPMRTAVWGLAAESRLAYLKSCTERCVKKPNSTFLRHLTECTEELRHVDVSGNYLGPKGLMCVIDMVAETDSVEVFDLSNTGTNSAVVSHLIATLSQHPSLHTLYLHNNSDIYNVSGRNLLKFVFMNERIVEVKVEGTSVHRSVIRRLEEVCSARRHASKQL